MGFIQGVIQGLTLVVGMSIGAGITYKIEHKKVVELHAIIDKIEATGSILQEQNKVKLLEAKAQAQINLNNLDKANESAIKTANGYHDILATTRLHDRNSKVCRDRVSENFSTRTSETNATGSGDLSEELSRLLRDESARADKETLDKNYLLEFVQAGCGI